MRQLAPLAVILAVPSIIAAQDRFGPITPIGLARNEAVVYQTEIETIFEEKCSYCHSGNLTEGQFDLASYASLMKGGKSGPGIVPGKPDESLIYQLSSRNNKPLMPPKSEEPLTPEELGLLRLWIEQGAKPPTGERSRPKVIVGLPPALVRPVRSVVLNGDGSMVAVSQGNRIHLIDVKTGETLRKLNDPNLKASDGKPAEVAHLALVDAMALSPDGKTLASGSFQEMKLWETESGNLRQTVEGFAERVVSIDYSPDGNLIATGGGAPTENGELRLFDAEGKLLEELPDAHSDTVFGVEFRPDGQVLASCGADKFVKTWEVPSLKFLKSLEGHTHHVLDVGWKGDDGKLLASGGADNVIKIWDFEKGEQTRTVNAHSNQITRLEFVGKSSLFITVSGDRQVKMWDCNNGANRRNYGGSTDFLYAIGVSDDGKILASGGEEGVVRVWEQGGKLLQTINPGEVKK